ncbi:MAG: ATP-binding cassette domain-containing protein [Clostridiaceae bacterium]
MEITIDDLQKSYGQRRILDVPHHVFEGGAIHQICGANGAGKSTLFEILCLLDEEYSGRVTVGRTDLRAIPADGRTVTCVFQQPVMLHRSVWDNLAYPLRLKGTTEAAIRQDLAFYLDYLPLDPLLHQKATNCSLGEAQKISLIRGLAMKTPVLLLDEPFSAMDAASRERSLALILEHQKQYGTTILMISHRELEHPMMKLHYLEGGKLRT